MVYLFHHDQCVVMLPSMVPNVVIEVESFSPTLNEKKTIKSNWKKKLRNVF